MTHVTVALHFPISDLRVSLEMPGSRVEFIVDDYSCAIMFPQVDFVNERIKWQSAYATTGRHPVGGRPTEYVIRELRIEVQVPSSGTIFVTPGADGKEPTVRHNFDVESLFATGEKIVNKALRRYLDYVRFRHEQYWLRSSSIVHRNVYNEVIDSTGHVIASNLNDRRGTVAPQSGDEGLLTEAKSKSIISQLEQDVGIELEEELLADARFMGWPPKDPYYRLATVLAAMACELKIKNTLVRLARPDQQELVEFILKNYRDVAYALIHLYDSGLKAVCGRSLREDDRELYKRINELFEIRNAIVHRGGTSQYTPDEGDIAKWTNYLRHARSAFEYLERLCPTGPPLSSEVDPASGS